MRILVLTNMFPPHSYGGYELWCRDVVRRWRRSGHEVMVLTGDVRFPDATGDEDPGIEVSRDLRLYWADHVVLDPSAGRRLAMERHNQRSLDRALSAFRPDVVSAWAMGAVSLGLLSRVADRGLPLAAVVCDEWPVYGPVVDAWSRLWAHRPRAAAIARLATGLPCRLPDLDAATACFVSEAVRHKVQTSSPWRFPGSVVVPSGIDRAEFPAAPDAGSRPWRWRLLHVGRVDPRKGLRTVIEAFAACPPEATLEMLGGGDATHLAELQVLIDELGVAGRVRFDQCPRAALAARYAAADAVVFAPVWDEPFGLVPLEAMACGTPVVASPTGGSAAFLADGENCVTFRPGDAGELAAALHRLASDPALRAGLAERGARTAARFDSDDLAGELGAWHRRAMEGRGRITAG